MIKYTTEQLSKITNDQLEKEFLSVRSEINIAKRQKRDSRDLEIYFCYVSREVQMRENLKNAKR